MASSREAGPDFGHYPYKVGDAHAVLDHPEEYGYTPDDEGRPDTHPSEHMTHDIAEASNNYVEAQHRFYTDTSDAEARTAFAEAEQALVRARRAHRAGRTGVAATTPGS